MGASPDRSPAAGRGVLDNWYYVQYMSRVARTLLRFGLGQGDLLVMGGSCQRDFEHGVPRVLRASGRISIVFRESLAQELAI